MNVRSEIVGIDCLMVRLFDRIDEGNSPWLLAATQQLKEHFGAALIDLVPSYTTLMVHFDLRLLSGQQARQRVDQALDGLQPLAGGQVREHQLPVWYAPQVGPELQLLSRQTGLSVSQVIELHSQHCYQVFALGFAPGFAYMGLVDERLAAPRISTPRKRVPAGSVGIAERQTATYPRMSPGGWNILGRTPATLFDLALEGHSLLQPGDRVRFEPIERSEFIRLGGDDSPLEALP
jgi:KipI family sensor histidine kinase inhibitor